MEDPLKDFVLWENYGKEIPVGMEQKWYGRYKIPAWMDFPEEGDSKEEGDSEQEEEGDSEEQMKRKMCIAWILARDEINKKLIQVDWKNFKTKGMERRVMVWRRLMGRMEMGVGELVVAEMAMVGRETTAGQMAGREIEGCLRWKVSEMDCLEDILLVILRQNLFEAELSYVMKRQLKEAQEKDMDMKLEANNNYLEFRNMWITIHSCWGGEFEDITNIIPLNYTNASAPRYVWNYGLPDTLQIFSVKVVERGDDRLHWPLYVFGMVAVRDCIDQSRIVIFNRQRHDCQILTKENPYLVLTGPSRCVVMKNDSIPVTIEAELKVKGIDQSEDKYLMLAAARVPSGFSFVSFDLNGRYSKLNIEAKRIKTCVEAVVFVRAINRTWSTGFSGYIGAFTGFNTVNMSIRGRYRNIVISEFGSDGPISDNGDVYQTRSVVAVSAHGYLMVFCKSWNDDGEQISDLLNFKAMKKGRSIGTLNVGSCTLEVIVAWSLIRPVCEELVRISEMARVSEVV